MIRIFIAGIWCSLALAGYAMPGAELISETATVRYSSTSAAFSPNKDTLLTTMEGEHSFHTNEEQTPWLIIDLKAQKAISGLQIVNRPGSHSLRASNLHIWLSNNDKDWALAYQSTFASARWNLTLVQPVLARYVKIGLVNETPAFFHLKGVQVIGDTEGREPITLQSDLQQEKLLANTKLFTDEAPISFDIRNIPVPNSDAPHLKEMGATSPDGVTLSANQSVILKDGKPMPLAMGEIHPQRYPAEYWEEAILEMKAGGLNAIAGYWFWAFIEPQRDVFDFTGTNNVRYFMELCKKHDMMVFPRIGPFTRPIFTYRAKTG